MWLLFSCVFYIDVCCVSTCIHVHITISLLDQAHIPAPPYSATTIHTNPPHSSYHTVPYPLTPSIPSHIYPPYPPSVRCVCALFAAHILLSRLSLVLRPQPARLPAADSLFSTFNLKRSLNQIRPLIIYPWYSSTHIDSNQKNQQSRNKKSPT